VGEAEAIRVHRVPASRIYFELEAVSDAILVQAEALIDAERRRLGLAPSTIGSSADGPPPAAPRGEVVRFLALNRG